MGCDVEIERAGERLRLMPERAVYWAQRETLLVADLHWGKAAALRAAAIPVPHGTTDWDLERLSAALNRSGARRLVLLGDVLHARTGRAARTLESVAAWRRTRAGLEILMVRGNHDRAAGDPPEELGIRCVEGPEVVRTVRLSARAGRFGVGVHAGGALASGNPAAGVGWDEGDAGVFLFHREVWGAAGVRVVDGVGVRDAGRWGSGVRDCGGRSDWGGLERGGSPQAECLRHPELR